MRNRIPFKLLAFIPAILLMISTTLNAASIEITDSYVRAVPPGHPNSAAFMTLINSSGQDRALVDAKSNISRVVELHTHLKEGGMMRMRRIEKIEIKAGGKAVLKPGGLHIMFIGLKKQLNPGDNVDLELIFDDGSHTKLTIPVKVVAGMMNKRPMH